MDGLSYVLSSSAEHASNKRIQGDALTRLMQAFLCSLSKSG